MTSQSQQSSDLNQTDSENLLEINTSSKFADKPLFVAMGWWAGNLPFIDPIFFYKPLAMYSKWRFGHPPDEIDHTSFKAKERFEREFLNTNHISFENLATTYIWPTGIPVYDMQLSFVSICYNTIYDYFYGDK